MPSLESRTPRETERERGKVTIIQPTQIIDQTVKQTNMKHLQTSCIPLHLYL